LPSLLFPAVRFAFVIPVLLARQMFPFNATLGMGGWWLDLTQQGLSPCKKYKTSWRSSAKGH